MTTTPTRAPFGTWRSPIDAALAAAGRAIPSWPAYVGREVWWTETRPEQGGRTTLLRAPEAGGSPVDLLPDPRWNVRSRVVEYGGRSWAARPADAHRPLRVVFSNYTDQRLYALDLPAGPLERRAPYRTP
ncbi:hypothetical protein [Streptomyces sp. MST-110588]|uniref:hypothetical protein n=1 Tax=Streptomyces sp. MST-110588 TaxID=2833628 RepID=UPI001F5D0F24|nr:hypothetical protein [Streptomyces sp. MST-110588]